MSISTKKNNFEDISFLNARSNNVTSKTLSRYARTQEKLASALSNK